MIGFSGGFESMGMIFRWSVSGIRFGGPGPELDDSGITMLPSLTFSLTTMIGSDMVRAWCMRWYRNEPLSCLGHEAKVVGLAFMSWPLISLFLPVNQQNKLHGTDGSDTKVKEGLKSNSNIWQAIFWLDKNLLKLIIFDNILNTTKFDNCVVKKDLWQFAMCN